MLYWLEKIMFSDIATEIPMPKTLLVTDPEIKGFSYMEWLDKGCPTDILERLKKAAGFIGYPLFWRTDHASDKHGGFDDWWTPKVEKPEDFAERVLLMADNIACKDLPTDAFVLREFIELDWKFKAFHEMPIAPERRYFVDGEDVECHHPYWPEAAIKFWGVTKETPNWREMLKKMNEETDEEVVILTDYASRIGGVLEGKWSIDFAKGIDGKWYFIDAALAEDSWHPKCGDREPVGEPENVDKSEIDEEIEEIFREFENND